MSSSKLVSEVVRLYLEGVPVKDIASRLSITVSRVYAILRKAGLKPSRRSFRRRRRRVTVEEAEVIKKLYLGGVSIYEIAKKLDRPPSTIYMVLKRLGLK